MYLRLISLTSNKELAILLLKLLECKEQSVYRPFFGSPRFPSAVCKLLFFPMILLDLIRSPYGLPKIIRKLSRFSPRCSMLSWSLCPHSGSPRFSGVSPSFSGVFFDFTSFPGRAPHFLGVVPELLLLPVFTSFFGSSSPFSGVVKETPDFSLASPDFPEALHLFSVLLKSTSLFWCSPAFFKAFSFSWYFRKITRFFRCSPAFSRCFFWIPSDFSPSLPGSSENFLDSLCVFDAFMAASPSQWYD